MPPASAQITAFRFDSLKVPVGRAFHYLKSNRDGTHPSLVSVYVRAVDRIEALKWDSGGVSATLVAATIDWTRFSPRRFEAFALERDQPEQSRATLEVTGSSVRVSFVPDSAVTIRAWPWHSYDFDFASLSLVLPHRIDPRAPFRFERLDVPADASGPLFRDLGEIRVSYAGSEQRLGAATDRLTLTGPGLDDTEGQMWLDGKEGHIVEYQIPIPDERGYRDGRLRLQRVDRMTPAQWNAFKGRSVGAPPRP